MNASQFSPTGHVSVFFDVDAMNLRVDGSFLDQKATGSASMIINGKQKNLTINVDQAVGILNVKGCRTIDAPMFFPSAETLRDLVKQKMSTQKPEGMDGDLRKFSMEIPAIFGLLPGDVTGEFDDDNLLHKVTMSVNGTFNYTTWKVTGSFNADQATGGAAPTSFEVPSQWAPCKPLEKDEGESLVLLAAAFFRDQPHAAPKTTVVV